MRVLVAGATGVIGRQLVPLLEATGHEVFALSRRGPVPGDLLDRAGLIKTVRAIAPDVAVHLATAIPGDFDPRKIDQVFAQTNKLRTEGTRNLIEAAGAARVISQSVAFGYQPGMPGSANKDLANEDTPMWAEPPKAFRNTLNALLTLERLTNEAGGLCLRFGHLYGPGTSYDRDGGVVNGLRSGKFPIVGAGTGVFSFTHTHDAATSIVSALSRPALTGALNIVDDTPALTGEFLPYLAELTGAPKPKRVPAWLARLFAGEFGVAYLTKLRGADNARARLELNWRPRYTSWREGFRAELG